MFETAAYTLGGSTGLALFLLSYLVIVMIFGALLGLGWSLDVSGTSRSWPQPQRYSRVFSLAFLCLLSTLGGFPPFFLLGPKLAIFSWLVGLGAWGSIFLLSFILLLGWYIYWQAATGLFDVGGHQIRPSKPLTRGGGLIVMWSLVLPLALSGLLLDLWALAHWLI